MACQASASSLTQGSFSAAWPQSSSNASSLCRHRYTQSAFSAPLQSAALKAVGDLRTGAYRRGRCARIACSAAEGSNGNNSEEAINKFTEDLKQRAADFAETAKVKASELAEETQTRAADLAEEARRRYAQFEIENDPQGKAQEAWRQGKVKAAEIGDDLRRTATRIDQDYKVRDKVKEFRETVQEKADEVDQKFSVRRKAATAWEDAQRNWPTFRRRVSEWLQTPLGKTATVVAVAYLIVSGWIFSILSCLMFLSFWVLPFLAPLVIRSMRGNVVQGQCPACKTPFAGPRTSVLSCRRCGGMVWQPRKDYSKADSKPVTIIDIEPE